MNWEISQTQREIFNIAQKVSPLQFIEKTKDKSEELKEISSILKRIISNILGREIVGEKILVAGS